MEDLSNGLESVKITACKDIGGNLPQFRYVITSIPGETTDTKDFELQFTGCECDSSCSAGSSCVCINLRSYGLNYEENGHLWAENYTEEELVAESKPIFECNRLCSCTSNGPRKCSNRVVQSGVCIDGLTVFATIDGRGWGLKTSTPIEKGTFVCEYAGEIIDYMQATARIKLQNPTDDNYIFVLREHVAGGKVICTYVDPTRVGNVGRFANHSCDPNLIVLPVRVDNVVPRLALFTKRHIQPGEELCFDYSGNNGRTEVGRQTSEAETSTRKLCRCGASTCNKYLPYDETLFAT